MLSSVGLEVMDSINPQLNWKIVTKGRRSRTLVARRKLSAAITGQPTSGINEHVPIKKRRHLLRSPSPQPRTPSICCLDSSSQLYSSSPLFEDDDGYPSHFSVLKSASSYSNWKFRDGSATIKFCEGFNNDDVLSEQEHNSVEDFSGIELLAAAASMDDDADKAWKEDLVVEESLMPKSSDIFNIAMQFKQDSECNKFINETVHEDDTDRPLVWSNLESATQSVLECVGDQTTTRADSSKVDRRHWDLNTLMDAWDEPYDDEIAGKILKDVANDYIHVEGRQECSEYKSLCNPAVAKDEFSKRKMKENKLVAVSPLGMGIESPSLEETLPEPANICYANVAAKTSDQDTEKNVDYKLASMDKIDSPNASVVKIDSPVTYAAMTTSHVAFVENMNLHSSFAEKADSYHASGEKADLYPSSGEKADPYPSPGEKADPYPAAEKADSYPTSAEKIDLCMTSAEKIDFHTAVDAHNYSDICLDNHDHVVDSGDLTMFQEGHDSPYEDGELRGSFLYQCEENESENQRVDYESDGRHGDSSDAGDLPGSEIVDGNSEGSHSSVRKSLLTKRFLGSNDSNSRAVQHSFMHFMEDESENNDVSGKNESNLDLVIGENVDEVKRRFSDQIAAVDDTVAHMDEYMLRTIRSKVQSCSKSRSSLDAFERKDIFFMQQCRSRPLGGSDSGAEKDMGSYKYLSRFRQATREGGKDGEDHWTYWNSRNRYTSNYQGAEGRSFNRPRRITGDSVDKFGRLDFDYKRQNANYLSKGFLHRRLVRSLPVDRDDCFGRRRRIPLTQGIRENYPPFVGKKFEPLPDEASKSGRPSHYLSSRERSFSPSSGRGPQKFTRRRSRSRSRTRSPTSWQSNRARNLVTRRHIRSPDFRSEARMGRMKLLNSNSTFTPDYRERYLSPSRGPQRNSRWFDDLSFADNHLRRRRSPGRLYKRSQRFDAIGSCGRLKSDDYFKSTVRPARFSFLANDGRGGKFGADYEHRRRDDRGGEVVHRRRDTNGGNSRRFLQSAEADILEMANSNNKDDVRGTDPRDVPQR